MKSSNLTYLIILALVMAVLPFGEQPHLWQKLLLLKDGYLHQPLDWFDFLMHGGPLVAVLVILAARGITKLRAKAAAR